MTPVTGKLLFRNKLYSNRIEVRDDGVNLSLYFSETILQSRMQKSHPHRLIVGYTQYMMLPLLIKIPETVLIIGIGGGSFLRFLHYHFPQTKIDAIDNCQETLQIANRYFSLPQSDKLNIFSESGEMFLEKCTKKYDLIMIDAFDQKGMSPTIYTDKTLSLCKKRLNADGLLCSNVWSADSEHLKQIKLSIEQNFTQALYIPVPKKGNIIAVAAKRPFHWQNLHPKNKLVQEMSDKLEIDFKEMVKNARRANMSIWQQLYQSINFQTA